MCASVYLTYRGLCIILCMRAFNLPWVMRNRLFFVIGWKRIISYYLYSLPNLKLKKHQITDLSPHYYSIRTSTEKDENLHSKFRIFYHRDWKIVFDMILKIGAVEGFKQLITFAVRKKRNYYVWINLSLIIMPLPLEPTSLRIPMLWAIFCGP